LRHAHTHRAACLGMREAREVFSTHCNTLQHTATHCNTLQHTATHEAGLCANVAARLGACEALEAMCFNLHRCTHLGVALALAGENSQKSALW